MRVNKTDTGVAYASGLKTMPYAACLVSVRQTGARERIDPRVSLAVLLVLNFTSFLSSTIWVGVLAVALDVILMLWCGRARLAIACALGYVTMVLVWLGCMHAGPFLAPVGTCFMAFVRIMPSAMFAALMIATTYVGEMACALQSVGLSNRMTVSVCVALRFFPTAAREARAVREAMLTRGIRLNPRTIIGHPALLVESFMVPFIHRISIVADELGDAVMVRAIEASNRRTCYYPLALRPVDVLVLLVAVALLVTVVVSRFL